MNFSAWSIRNPIAPILAFFMLMVLGWQSFTTLPITRFPNIDLPLVAISVGQQGAAPAELEMQVTREIEDAVAGISGVKNIMSTVTDGNSSTAVEFTVDTDSDKAVQDVKDAIDRIRSSLPADVDDPVVTKIDIEGQAILTYAVSAPGMTVEELSWFVDDTVKRALQGEPGVGRVDRYGGADREVRVELDPVKLDSLGITAATVSRQLRATNTNLGAGRSEIGAQEQAIRTLGDAQTVEGLAGTTIALPGGQFVRLEALGRVLDTYQEMRSFSRFNGEPVVTFGVFRAKGASEVSVKRAVTAALKRLAVAYPEVTIGPVDDAVTFTEGNYTSSLDTLLEGAILAALVVLLFLRNWRATLIAAVALPLSAVPTFWVMDLLGFSLNMVSFLAITLATGILVDDAIVEIENIARHMKMGKTPYRAAIDAAREIGLAVIATSSTIVAVFVPVSFMPGIPGQYFRQFGMTVAIAVLFSLAVARLITPMMAAYLMRDRDAHGTRHEGPVLHAYTRFVAATLKARYLTLLSAIGVLAVSVYYLTQVPGAFMPADDVGRVSLSVELPPGATLADTEVVAGRIQAAVAGIDGVQDVFILGGASPTGDMDVRNLSVTLLLDPLDESMVWRLSTALGKLPLIGPLLPKATPHGRIIPQAVIETEALPLLAAIPDLRISKLNDRGQRDITFSILSQDPAALDEAARRLEAALRGDPLLESPSAEGALPRPEIQIVPREAEAARLGVTAASIAETVRVATIGDYDAALAKISLDNRLIPVRVELGGDLKADLARLGALKVPTASGPGVPLSSVAEIRLTQGPAKISRLNRERLVTIGASLPPGVVLGTATARFNELVQAVELPAGVRIAESGDAEIMAEMEQSFFNAMLMGLMLVLTVLILLFKSVIQPFTILFSLPLAIGGVAAGLILTSNPVSMPVLIGILMLMGIVTKNAILLVDFAIVMRAQGMERVQAVIEAGRKRAQPIVMTSIAMSAGMLPSALGVGAGGVFRSPMAIAVIGGIIVSTVLSLIVVPSFFLIMDDLSRLLGRLFSRLVGPKEAEPAPPDPQALAEGVEGTRAELDALKDRLRALESQSWRPHGGTLHVAE